MTTNRGIDPIINDMFARFMNCEGGAAEKLTAMLDKFETELTEAIEDFSYEFVDAPNEMLAPDDDPAHDLALEVQTVFTSRLLREHFSALLEVED